MSKHPSFAREMFTMTDNFFIQQTDEIADEITRLNHRRGRRQTSRVDFALTAIVSHPYGKKMEVIDASIPFFFSTTCRETRLDEHLYRDATRTLPRDPLPHRSGGRLHYDPSGRCGLGRPEAHFRQLGPGGAQSAHEELRPAVMTARALATAPFPCPPRHYRGLWGFSRPRLGNL